ncbi:MAG: efflux RND transporter periplasmic adaptor subunit [Planctomycetota bacterium]|nr:efflux RND transporter periplasmic adaptor subunit [Planctomycetota bacterium]
MISFLRVLLRILLPLLVLGAGAAAAVALAKSREEAPTVAPPRAIPRVRAVIAEPVTWQARIRTTGTVRPAVESDVTSEVAARVVEVALAEGSFFTAGDVLARFDPSDYELAVVQATAEVAQAALAVELQREESEAALREWQAMQRPGEPTDLVLRKPQLAEAAARLEAASARLEAARRDVERCVIRAPYDGRVLSKFVDLGQYVGRNARVARVYATAAAEVRLPIPDSELAFLDIGVVQADGIAEGAPEVTLSAEFAGRQRSWKGRVVRTEGELDGQSRMVRLVAHVDAPYAAAGPEDVPMVANLFVTAEILGPTYSNVFVLPRRVLRGQDQVLVIDGDDRLHSRSVDILRTERESIIVATGLEAGERVCSTPLEAVVEGMSVRVATEEGR